MPKPSEGVHLEISADAADAIKELTNVIKSLNSTQKAANDLQGALKNSGNAQLIDPQTGKDIKEQVEGNINEALDQLRTQARNRAGEAAKGAVVSFGQGLSGLASVMDNAGKVIEKGFGRMLKGITATVGAISGVITVITKNALNIGGSFEAQMANVKVISGATAEELEELTKKAREMGAALPISAKDAAQAMELLAQRGNDAKKIIATVTDVSNLAISQNVDMASAAELLGSAMTNFGIAVENASKVTDIFNNASNQSALSMSKLADGLKYVGPAASAAGMKLEEAISAMEVLANSGFDGSMIGTGLSMTLSKLAGSAEVLGVRTKNLDGTLRPMKDIFSELQTKGMTLGQATATFGERAAKSAINLTKYANSLAGNEENLKKWGSTQAAVQEKMKTWPNTWAAFKSAVEEVHIEIFEQIKEQSKEAVKGVTNLTRTFSQWVGETKIASQSLNAFLSGLGFDIPAGDDFKKLLEKFDVRAFVERIKGFGSTLSEIGNGISRLYATIKGPLTFLLEHIDTFGKLSFWGWIIGKGLQVPMALIGIADAFVKLHGALKMVSALNLTSLLSFLTTPWGLVAAGVAAVGGMAYYAHSKYEEAREAEEEIRRLNEEIREANDAAVIDVKLRMETGFEELPASYAKASQEMRNQIAADVKVMQEAFKGKIAQAIEAVNAKAGEMGEDFKATAEDISDALAKGISQALEGNKEAFDKLPDYWKKVTVRLAEIGEGAGHAVGNIGELIASYKIAEIQAKKTMQQVKLTEAEVFSNELSQKLDLLLRELPAKVERAKELMGGNVDLAVNIQLEAAHEELEKFVKEAAEKYRVPESIIETGLLKRLKELSAQNNKTAQSLVGGWKGAKDSVSEFIERAKDAVTYLGASPSKFTHALNSLMKNIQKIDPLTGRVTEAFKKGHDALKEWANVTFDKLSQRIQRLKKAVEGGFLNRKALEDEFQNLSKELKLQIVTELEPTRGQYRDKSAFEGVVASEYMARLAEIGGEAMVKKAREEFSRAYQWTGESIGRAILDEVQRLSGKANTGTIQRATIQTPQGITDLSQQLSSSLTPLVSKMEAAQSGQLSAAQDIVNAVSPLTSVIQALMSGLSETRETVAANTSGMSGLQIVITSAQDSMLSLENTVLAFENSMLSAEDTLSPLLKGLEEQLRQNYDKPQTVRATETANPDVQDFASNIIAFKEAIDADRAALNEVREALLLTRDAFLSVQEKPAAQNTGSPISASALQTIVNGMDATRNSISANTLAMDGITARLSSTDSALQRTIEAIASTVAVLNSQPSGTTYNVEIHQHGFVIQSKGDADMTARAASSAFRTGIGNGGS